MKIVRIFVSDNTDEGLWTIHLDSELHNEFERFFDLMNDVEWLRDFFVEHEADLNSGFFGLITVEDAVLKTLDEVEQLEDALYDYTERGFAGRNVNLQHLFRPLSNFEYAITVHQKSKARIRKGWLRWLRLYALRLAEHCFLVTGGAIKLTPDMKRSHLQHELRKLELASIFLHENGIDYPEDLNIYCDD